MSSLFLFFRLVFFLGFGTSASLSGYSSVIPPKDVGLCLCGFYRVISLEFCVSETVTRSKITIIS